MTRETARRGAVKDFDVSITGIPFAPGPRIRRRIWASRVETCGTTCARRTGGLQFSGTEGGDGRPTTISGRISLLSGEFKYHNYPKSAVKAKLNFEQAVGSRKIELRPSGLKVGGLAIEFQRRVRARPGGNAGHGR